MKKAIGLLVLLMFAAAIINSCGGGGGGGTSGPGPVPSGDTTTVSGAVRLSSTLSKPGVAKAGVFSALMSAATGTPLDNAIVEMYDADHPEWLKPISTELTLEDGSFKLAVLKNSSLNTGATYTNGDPIPAGNYTLIASKSDYMGTGKTVIAVQGFVKRFAGDVVGQDLIVQDETTVPEVEYMFGLAANTDGTFGGSGYTLASNAAVQITFNTAMRRQSLLDAISIIDGSSNAVPGIWKVSADLQSATFYSSATLTTGTLYTVTVSGGTNTFTDPKPATSLYSLPLEARATGSFQAGGPDTVNPSAIAISPATSNNVLIGTPIQIASNDPLDLNTFVVTSSPSIGDKPSVKYAGVTSDWGNYKYVYTIVPDSQLQPNTSYNISVSGSKDLAGNPLNSLNFSFGTESATAVPIVSSATPTGTSASVKALVKAGFSASVDSATVTSSTVLVTEGTATGTPVSGLVSFKNNEAIFTPAADLSYATAYTVKITTGIKSLWGIPMAADYSWTFKTAAAPDTTAPTTTASPAGGTYGTSQNVALTCNDNGGSGCSSIYYTTNGTEPTTASATYVSAIPITTTTTLKFFAKDVAGNTELVKTETYTIDSAAPVTTASPAAGTYNTETNVTLTTNKAGSAIYFTTDVSTPTTSSTTYSAPISLPINTTTTVKYFAVDTYGHAETVKSSTYTIDTIAPSGSIVISGGATRTKTGNLTLTLSATDNLTGVTQMALSNEENFGSQVLSSYATTTSWNILGTQGVNTVYVKFKDGAGNWSNPVSSTITFDSVQPQVLSTSPTASGTGINIGTTISAIFDEDMDLSSMNVLNVVVMEGINTVYGPVTYDQLTRTVTFTPSFALGYSKTYTVTVKKDVKDLAGNLMTADMVWTFTTKAAPPISETTVSPPGGTYMATSMTVTLVASDVTATIYYTTNDVDPTSSTPTKFVGSGGVLLSSGTTTLKFYSQITGTTANEGVKSQTYVLDTTQPSGTITISGSGGAVATNTTSVTLTMAMTDTGSGMAQGQMRFSNDGGTWSEYEPYNTTKAWNMTAGDSLARYVYAQFKDKAGNESGIISDFIILDTVAPVLSGCNINNNLITTSTTAVNFYRTVSDAAPSSGVTEMSFWTGSAWGEWQPIGALAYNATTLTSAAQGQQTLYYQVRDAAGSVASWCSDNIYYDYTAPTPGTISINGGAAYTNSTSAYTYLYPSDTGSYIAYYSTNAGSTWTAGGTSGTYLPIALSAGDGTKSVSVDYKDAAGYVTATAATDTIVLDQTAPYSATISINGGAAATNNPTVTLSLSSLDATSGVSQMQIYNEAYLGAEAYATSKSVTVPTGDGTKYVYAQYKDAAGNWTGWVSDTITLDTIAPALNYMSPAQCSTGLSVNYGYMYVYVTDTGSGIDPATVNSTTVTLWDDNLPPYSCTGVLYKCIIGLSCTDTQVSLYGGPYVSGNTIYFYNYGLTAANWYYVRLSGVKDKAGNTLPTTIYNFKTL